MTTWAPEPDDVVLGHHRLDDQRLNAQRGGEGLILARGMMARLRGEKFGWQHHPASVMWTGHERAFMEYQVHACRVWRGRGFHDECLGEYVANWTELPDTGWPLWWGHHEIHSRHRVWLLIRRPDHYEQYGWPEVEEAREWRATVGVETEPPLDWPVPVG